MPIKVEREDGTWVEFRDDRWTFGDRRLVLEATTDWDALDIIVAYVMSWNVKDVDGASVRPRDGDNRPVTSAALANLDDDVARWLVRAWFQAKAERTDLPKVS